MQENEMNVGRVTAVEAAGIAGCSRMTIFRKRRNGELPFERDSQTGRISYQLPDLLKIGQTR